MKKKATKSARKAKVRDLPARKQAAAAVKGGAIRKGTRRMEPDGDF